MSKDFPTSRHEIYDCSHCLSHTIQISKWLLNLNRWAPEIRMKKDLVRAELHAKWAIHQHLKTETYKILAIAHATVANTCQLKALRWQDQSQCKDIFSLNYELQARLYWLWVEKHQEKSEQYYLIAFDSENRAVAHERLAHYLQNHDVEQLKVENCENSK